jgi:hypothetical protein
MSHEPRARFTYIAAPLASLVWLLASCSGDGGDPRDDRFCENALKSANSLDALDWLKTPAPGAIWLIGRGRDDSMAFAHELEIKGAKRIVAVAVRTVPGPPPAPETPGAGAESYQTADGLVVELPEDPSKRLAIFRLYAKQARDGGYEPRSDSNQKYVFIPSRKP